MYDGPNDVIAVQDFRKRFGNDLIKLFNSKGQLLQSIPAGFSFTRIAPLAKGLIISTGEVFNSKSNNGQIKALDYEGRVISDKQYPPFPNAGVTSLSINPSTTQIVQASFYKVIGVSLDQTIQLWEYQHPSGYMIEDITNIQGQQVLVFNSFSASNSLRLDTLDAGGQLVNTIIDADVQPPIMGGWGKSLAFQKSNTPVVAMRNQYRIYSLANFTQAALEFAKQHFRAHKRSDIVTWLER